MKQLITFLFALLLCFDNILIAQNRDSTGQSENFSYPFFRVALGGGLSYRTANYPKDATLDQKAYIDQLRSGRHIDLNFSYFFSEWGGLGLKLNVSFANAEANRYKDNILIGFIGPFFSYRLLDKKKQNCFLIDWGLGYLGYHDRGSIPDQGRLTSSSILITGQTLGVFMNLGYDIWLSETVSLGFQLSMMNGKISKFSVIPSSPFNQPVLLEDGEGLGRIDLSIGLRF
ncbi:MAG: hypothetical protein LBU91_00970 [Bacteroidales bacterium]|jgi:hypothetical protein|nr:hypothetical protein [Bacteroidales bacterium]